MKLFGTVARSVRMNIKFGDICQNEFLLFGMVAGSVRMNLNFGDGCQNAFLLLGTVARMHFYCLGRLPEVSEKSKLWGRLPECISIGWDGCPICHFYH